MQLGQGHQRRHVAADSFGFKQKIKIGPKGRQLAHNAAFVIAQHPLIVWSFIFIIQGQIIGIAV